MSVKEKLWGNEIEKMSNMNFRRMLLMYKVYDFFIDAEKKIAKQIHNIGIKKGSVVVDYGCGPGRYLEQFSQLLGANGKLYAVDVHEMAIDMVKNKIEEQNISNVKPILANGYSCDIQKQSADVVCALDVFHMIKEPSPFLGELHRLLKKDGILIISDGHQSREMTQKKITDSNKWNILEATEEYLKCSPI